jgi:hypothetical protein
MKTESNPFPPSPLYLDWLKFKATLKPPAVSLFARWITKDDDDGFTRAKFKRRAVQ